MSQFPGNNQGIESLIENAISRLIDALDRRERDRFDQTGTNSQSRDSDIREIRQDVEEMRNLLAQTAAAVSQMAQNQDGGA